MKTQKQVLLWVIGLANLSGARIANIEIKKLFLMVLGKDMCFVKRIVQDIRTIGSVLMEKGGRTMPDREKVIKEYEDYVNSYISLTTSHDYEFEMHKTVLALLKEQQQQIWELQDQVEYLTDKLNELIKYSSWDSSTKTISVSWSAVSLIKSSRDRLTCLSILHKGSSVLHSIKWIIIIPCLRCIK